MALFKEKYVNPFTDFGFKKLFGEEPNKDLLLDFLNEILREQQGNIVNLTYLKSEQLGKSELDRKAVFDLYCENEKGEKFIVEMQKSKQNYFKDRSVYYSTFPIQNQAKKSDWNYQLNAVYTIGILDFEFNENINSPEQYRYDVKLTEQTTSEVFYDKLTYIYFEMPKFKKDINELSSKFDKWMYVLKNLNKLERLPDNLRESIFEKVFEVAEISKFTKEEYNSYEDSLKSYRDLKNSLDTAWDEGKAEGIEQGIEQGIQRGIELEKVNSEKEKEELIVETVTNAIKMGLDNLSIHKLTQYPMELIKELRAKLK